MNYRNIEIKLDQLVAYFNEEKINLSPAFQPRKSWTVAMRRKFITNIIRQRPIPSIVICKDEDGGRYTYSILDGKQRLESILLFIASENKELQIKTWRDYILDGSTRKDAGFAIKTEDGTRTRFADFGSREVRELREYPIPTIEISLNEDTHLDEIISLVVDMHQRQQAQNSC